MRLTMGLQKETMAQPPGEAADPALAAFLLHSAGNL